MNILGITEIAGNIKNVRTITLTAVLVALTIVANGVIKIPLAMGLEIRFGFLFLSVIAFLFGPVPAFAAGTITSMLTFVLFPTGFAFNPLFDLNAGLAGFLYAVFLYKKNPKSEYFIVWILCAKASVNFICNIIVNTYLLRIYFGSAAQFITLSRVFKNIALLPIEIILMLLFIKFIAVYTQKYNFINPAHIKIDKTGEKRGNVL